MKLKQIIKIITFKKAHDLFPKKKLSRFREKDWRTGFFKSIP